jgi:sugar phosphate isomerase/epimerase
VASIHTGEASPHIGPVPPPPFPGLVASFFTLSGAGFGQPPRNTFIERCEAAAAAGFTGIGCTPTTCLAPSTRVSTLPTCRRSYGTPDSTWWRLNSSAAGPSVRRAATGSLAAIEGVADALGGRQVSAGEFSADVALDTDESLTAAARSLKTNADRLASRGLLVALESFPWSALTNTAALEILHS